MNHRPVMVGVTLLLALCYWHFALRGALVELEVDSGARRHMFKIYWAGSGEEFSEKRMSRVLLEPGVATVRFRIGDLGGMTSLRLDPSERGGAKVLLRRLTIRQEGFPLLRLVSVSDFKGLLPVQGVRELDATEQGLRITTQTQDAQLLWRLPPLAGTTSLPLEGVRLGLIGVLVYAVALAMRETPLADLGWVSYLATGILALVLTMAVVTARDAHPDEGVHIAAAQYYQDHWLPPKIGDPAIRDTYSLYGISRLHSGEIFYWIAGKYLRLLAPLQLPPHLALRSFNVLLWAVMLLWMTVRPPARLLALPLLISPQIWYVFSYGNSDAFALFLAMALVWQATVPDSMFRRLGTASVTEDAWRIIGLGLLLALILLCKKNIYFFLLFLGGALLWGLLQEGQGDWRRVWRPWGLILVVALLGYVLVLGVDYGVNGPDRRGKLEQARRDYAAPLFHPDTPLAKLHPHLRMRERGSPLASILDKGRWGEKTFRSSFGVYGYTSVSASFPYYDTMRWLAGGMLVFTALAIALRGGRYGLALLLLFFSIGAALILSALYCAWAIDFQAQGRYFLPLIPMLALLLGMQRGVLPAIPLQLGVLALAVVSLYGFLVVGLPGLVRLYGM